MSSDPVCAFPWQQMIVNMDGTVFPCCYWSNYNSHGPAMGNLSRQSLPEIWNGPQYQELRYNIVHRCNPGYPCHNCMYYLTSGGNHAQFDLRIRLLEDSISGRNILLAKEEYNQHATILSAMPIMMNFVSTTKCNIRCTFCNQYTQHLEQQSLSSFAVSQILDYVPYYYMLAWYGGECFLDPQCRNFLKTFKREMNPNLGFCTATNGVLADEKILNVLLGEFSYYGVTFSMESFNPEDYALLQEHSNYHRAINNLKRFQAATQLPSGVNISTCMMKSTIPKLPRLLRDSAELDIAISLSPVLVWPPTEVLDVFTDFERETCGWAEILDEAILFARQKESEGYRYFQSGPPLNPVDTVLSLKESYLKARSRYQDCHKITVKYMDIPIPSGKGGIFLSTFDHNQELCFASPAGSLVEGANLDLVLMENDKELGPKVVNHDLIRSLGKGRFSIGRDYANNCRVLFSTSDGSDPAKNGRRYFLQYVLAPEKDPLGRKRRPVLIAAHKNNLSKPVGYLSLKDPGVYEMDIPRDIDISELVYYTLIDVLDQRDRCFVNRIKNNGGGKIELIIVRAKAMSAELSLPVNNSCQVQRNYESAVTRL
jgi:radical SAM protein with 4Fe4S-binding SPASM domain